MANVPISDQRNPLLHATVVIQCVLVAHGPFIESVAQTSIGGEQLIATNAAGASSVVVADLDGDGDGDGDQEA